ncbi:hypothetical protein [Deinococcus arenicola]|uniref:Uncharacterized protein n=1 Tax=Deinococcus arenicola TaxID=2994950 RepID=A0ABU4DUB5_9DEIO|nr:hypothetical protein [Deinococcus sp. ZS9-10]MDV6376028.1 hypothetical protein [Deinococcus sp. ZS9-10]
MARQPVQTRIPINGGGPSGAAATIAPASDGSILTVGNDAVRIPDTRKTQDSEAVYVYRRADGLVDVWMGRPGNYWVVQTVYRLSAIAGMNTYGITDCPWSPGGIRVKMIDQRRPDLAHNVLDEILLSTKLNDQAIDLAIAEAGRPDPGNYHAGNIHGGDERVWHRFHYDGVAAELPDVGQFRRCTRFELQEQSIVYSKVSSIDPDSGTPLKFWTDRSKWVKLADFWRLHRWEGGRAHFSSDLLMQKNTRMENGYIMMLGLSAPIVIDNPSAVPYSAGTVKKAALLSAGALDLMTSPIPGITYTPATGAAYWNPDNGLSIKISTTAPTLKSFIQDTSGAHGKYYRCEWLSNAQGEPVTVGERHTVPFTIDILKPLP